MSKHQSLPPTPGSGLSHTSAQQLPPKEPRCPESSFTWSSHEGVTLPLASGFTEPHPTPQQREEVAENQGLCEPLRILRMSHFPWGGWEGLVGGRGSVEANRRAEELKEEPGQSCDPPSSPGATFPVPQSLPEGTMSKLLPEISFCQHLAQVGREQLAGSKCLMDVQTPGR